MIRVFAQGLKKLPKNIRFKLGRTIGNMKNFHGRIHLYEATAPAKDFFIGQALVFEEARSHCRYCIDDSTSGPSVAEIVAPYYEKVKDLDEEVNKMQYLDVHQWMPERHLIKSR